MESPGKAGDRYRAAVNPEDRALPAECAGAAVPIPPRKWRLPVVPLLHNRHNIRGTTKEVLSNYEDKAMPLAILLLCLAADPASSEVLPLLDGETLYREAKGEEARFEGFLERNAGSGRLGSATHFNAYRITWIDAAGKPGGREVFVPGKAHLLAEYLGQRVRLIAKAIDTEADGKTYHELWPARLETLTGAAAKAPQPDKDGIVARCYWRPGSTLQVQPRLSVFRDGEHLVPYLRLSGTSLDETATKLMAERLGVPTIDWKKHMLVSVSAGLRGQDAERLTVTRVVVQEKVLTVYYRLEAAPGGAGGFGIPAETVLVERFEGEVRLEVDATAPPAGDTKKP
jgi:hypothetical protein